MRTSLINLINLVVCSCVLAACATNTTTDTQENTADPANTEIRRAHNYKGWVAIKRQTLEASAAEDDWIFMSGIESKDNGQITPILDDGKATGYSVQLAVLTYENTQTPVLKLGLIEDKTGKTITYIWGEPGAKRLGMNLRWFQVGMTKVAEIE